MNPHIVIIGAGLAGLAAARNLHARGAAVTVMEAESEVGGRLRSDHIDGFTCDHGFALINPAYPALRRYDLASLDVQSFAAGALVRGDDGVSLLADPVREPQWLRDTLTSGLVSPTDLVALVRAVARAGDPDASWAQVCEAAGFTGPLATHVVAPFLAGVLADRTGATSARVVRDLLKYFVLGKPGVPAGGMGQLAATIAAPLLPNIHLQEDVTVITRTSSRFAVEHSGGQQACDAVVIATRSDIASVLLSGEHRGGRVPGKGLATWWFAADEAPHDLPLLSIEGRESAGPLVNAAVMTNVAPSYAPAGRHLIAASAVLGIEPHTDTPTEQQVRDQLGEMFMAPSEKFELITGHVIPDALPHVPPGKQHTPTVVAPGLAIAGDYQRYGSINEALASGEHAADQLWESLANGR